MTCKTRHDSFISSSNNDCLIEANRSPAIQTSGLHTEKAAKVATVCECVTTLCSMGNTVSAGGERKRGGETSNAASTRRREAKHVNGASEQCKRDHKKEHKMNNDSVNTFAPQSHNNASVSSHHRRSDPVMITDALSDVRVNYHIDAKELGHGHYGIVRRCIHRESNRTYAIKSIQKSRVSKIEVLKREIEILKEVKHPHIIELIEVYEDEKYLHLVTEICTGGELFDRIIAKTASSEGHFSEHDAAVLVRDILDAIRYCHDEKGIVHRDLKPENFLFLTQADDAPVKIIDFGLSRHDDTDLGIMQTKVGTPYYVAPEVLRREYTKSCDIWSIGVITYILLCGYPPFYGDSDTQIFESVRVGKFDFPSPEWDDISQEAKDFVIKLLEKEPARRPTAAVALRHDWLRNELGMEDFSINRASISHLSQRTGTFTNYLAMKKLKKAALGYIASNLTHEEVGTLETIFKSMDKDGNGRISVQELDEAISQGNFSENILHDLRALRTDLAITRDQQLDWRDFLASTMDRTIALRENNMRMAFAHFGHTDAEYLTIDDLADIFGGIAQAREVMNVLDTNRDGKVYYEDFRHALVESLDDDDEETEVTDSSNHDLIS